MDENGTKELDKRSIRIGISLFVVGFLLYIPVVVVPFLGWTIASKVIWMAVLASLAEGLFFVGIIFIGKELAKKLRNPLRFLKYLFGDRSEEQ